MDCESYWLTILPVQTLLHSILFLQAVRNRYRQLLSNGNNLEQEIPNRGTLSSFPFTSDVTPPCTPPMPRPSGGSLVGRGTISSVRPLKRDTIRPLGSEGITVQESVVETSSTSHPAPRKPSMTRATLMPLGPPPGSNGPGSLSPISPRREKKL